MPAITVQVGNEEKEISGLNRKTTCAEVIEALMNDRHVEIKDLLEKGQAVPGEEQENFKNADFSKLAKNYIIVENWRGCEKPLPPQTRILAVWRAWGKEQCHVKFALKKDKNSLFCEERQKDEFINFAHFPNQTEQTESSHYIHKLSHGQKKRIRRSMMQYQRAVLLQRTQERIDGNNNAGKNTSKRGDHVAGDRLNFSRQKSSSGPKGKITLSEEQFVDGVVGAHNKFLHNVQFKKERCNYRRPHHRRLSLLQDDSDGVTDQNVTLTRANDCQNYHSPNMSKKRTRSRQRSRQRSSYQSRTSQSDRRRKLLDSKSGTDSTTSTASFGVSSDIEHDSYSEGDEADDEKSVMADFNTSVSRQTYTDFAESLLPCVETYSSGAASASTATITDTSSATTTCSETSNISGSSFTTSSSETSGGTDLELYYARKEAANAAKANVTEKPKSGAAKLFRIAKPQSLIDSFKRKKKTQNAPQSISTSNKPVQVPSTPNSKLIPKQSEKVLAQSDRAQKNSSSTSANGAKTKDDQLSEVPAVQNISEEEKKAFEELQELVLSREKSLKFETNKLNSVSTQIERIESQISRWNVEDQDQSSPFAHQRDSKSNSDKFSNFVSTTWTPEWIRECSNADALAEYVSVCERIVAKQMQIEEQKRNAEILVQEIQNEVWRTSNDLSGKSKPNSLNAAALELMNGEADDSSDDEAATTIDALSVSSCKTITPSTDSTITCEDSADSGLEVERTRAEMEANLYLGLRLSTELEEVDKLMSNSQQLLQSKGEALLALVRDLAQSDEGISPDLWDEYGDLLQAYDAEVALQLYLMACAESDVAKRMLSQNEDGAQPQSFLTDLSNVESSPASTDALQHALSPWLWCEHCKEELERAQKYGGFENAELASPHWLSHSEVPLNFSSLPLPSPSVLVDSRSTRASSLLPMPPVPDCNDSDYDDLPDKKNRVEDISATSTIISTEDSIPRGVVLRHYPTRLLQGHQDSAVSRSTPAVDSLSSTSVNSSSNTDDSGNASAGSTASFASDTTDLGSRNSSCDGGSPKPSLVGFEDPAQSSPYFARSKNTSKNKFLFPHSNGFKQPSKLDHSKNRSYKPSKPAVPTKPIGLKPLVSDPNFWETPKQLTRSNSGRSKRSFRAAPEIFSRRATSFGKGAIKGASFPNQLTGILKKPFAHGNLTSKNSTVKEASVICNNTKTKQTNKSVVTPQIQYSSNIRTPHNATVSALRIPNGRHSPGPMHFSVYADSKSKRSPLMKDQNLFPYDNDSDTGLSSLHSTDSCDRLNANAGETLV